MSATTAWWWVRHAPVPGAPVRIFGQLDVDCDTNDGVAFAALAALLPDDALWIVSPLRRTRQTADAVVAAGKTAVEPRVEAALMEQNFGRWQGLSWTEMEAADADAYARFWHDPVRNAPPEGESYAALMQRAAPAITRLTESHRGRPIVCVSHGGTIRAAVALALGLAPETAMAIAVDNLSVTRLDHIENGVLRGRGHAWRVATVNAPCRWIPRERL